MVSLSTNVCAEGVISLREDDRKLNVLVVSAAFPWSAAPVAGIFVKERLKHLSDRGYADIRVISPKPYFPPLPWFSRWYLFSQVQPFEEIDGLPVHYPRYVMLPKIGGYIHPWLMLRPTWRKVRKIVKDFQPDLIDAHFVYPSGVVAEKIARRLSLPVVITGRGEDMVIFPRNPFLACQIQRVLKRGTRFIAVSNEIRQLMERNGADPHRISVIPNGVDLTKFRVLDRTHARQMLGLPLDCPVAVTVGYRVALKGFDIFIDAIKKLTVYHPNILGLIVGGPAQWKPDIGPQLARQIEHSGLIGHVRLIGYRPQQELALWYNAADVFVLLSSREGSPNVVVEALACGTPVVATRVGGIPDLLRGQPFAILLPERSALAAAEAIRDVLASPPDRALIRRFAESHGWQVTAEKVYEVWQRAILDYRTKG